MGDISASQYGWNIVQGLINVAITNKITDCISHCQSVSDVCKLIRQVRREMENQEVFTGFQQSQRKVWKKSIGSIIITILLQEEEVIQTEVVAEVIIEVIAISPVEL